MKSDKSVEENDKAELLKELVKAHETLLVTLHASSHPWIQKVHRNAAAYYYQTWKPKYEFNNDEANSKDEPPR